MHSVADKNSTNKTFDKSCKKCKIWKPFINKSMYIYISKIYVTINVAVEKMSGVVGGQETGKPPLSAINPNKK